MIGNRRAAAPALLAAAVFFGASLAHAAPPTNSATEAPVYKPPPRGAPGGRVGGASRGTVKLAAGLPEIDLIAPDGEAGETASPAPTLYYYISRPMAFPTRLTISAPWQAAPIIETPIPQPQEAGIHRVPLARYGVELQRGVVYTWSISAIVNRRRPSRDIVASASLLRVVADPALEGAARRASPRSRAALFAQGGLWYDAVAAAAEAAGEGDRGLGALMRGAGIEVPVKLGE